MIKPPDFYCSNKFTFLKIDFEKGTTYNCHAARPQPVDFKWLEKNPGQLFNTEINCQEREQMLAGQRNASCEQNCYPAEDRGQVSTRMIESTIDRMYTDVYTQPHTLDITLFSDCNLTCSYCCKEYSSAWRRDLEANGPYILDGFSDSNRYSINIKDRLVKQFSQREKQELARVKSLIAEVKNMQTSLKTLIISGGEPLLNNHVLDVIHSGRNIEKLCLFSGLGVDYDRFQKLVDKLVQYKNLTMYISAECTESLYEFNRYGSSWDDFCKRIELLKQAGINFEYWSSISNLTAPGFAEFVKFANGTKIQITLVNHPRFMSVGNLDTESKQKIQHSLAEFKNYPQMERVVDSLSAPGHTEQDRVWLRDWLQQFSQRKKIGLDCFSEHFLKWLQL